jgi:hypothetical protein
MEEISEKIVQLETKIDDVAKTVRKIKLYLLTILVLSLITFALPLIALIFVIPWFLRTIETTYQGLL